jgi:hypothetical protein
MEDRLKRHLSLITINKPADVFSYPRDLLEPIEVPQEPDMTLERQILERFGTAEERKADLRIQPTPIAHSHSHSSGTMWA